MKIQKVTEEAFRVYGRVIRGIDFSDLLERMEHTPLPEENVVYVASDPGLEACGCAKEIQWSGYGGMPVQIGYCNGKNNRLNAVEYHRDSEIDIAATDCVLLVGRQQEIEPDGTYDTAKMEAFFVPAKTAVELYATTLHYAPCNASPEGFRVAIVLPAGTNTEIEKPAEVTGEDRLLFARNKWLIAHREAKLEGAFCGLKGENLSLRLPDRDFV